jgi:hypothetical protein
MKFACPKCDSRLRLPETFAGERRITCPHCRCDFPFAGDEGEARSAAVDRSSSSRRSNATDEQRGSFRPLKRHKTRKSINPPAHRYSYSSRGAGLCRQRVAGSGLRSFEAQG